MFQIHKYLPQAVRGELQEPRMDPTTELLVPLEVRVGVVQDSGFLRVQRGLEAQEPVFQGEQEEQDVSEVLERK